MNRKGHEEDKEDNVNDGETMRKAVIFRGGSEDERRK